MIDKLILSDAHAGLPSSRWRDILPEIDRHNPTTVVINGDAVDSCPIEPIDEWLNILKGIHGQHELIWIRGNHDWLLAPALARRLGIWCLDRYHWADANGRNIAIHGHQFDSLAAGHPELSQVATELYAGLQEVLGPTIADYMKHVSKVITGDAKKVSLGAANMATRQGVQNIFCGHVHATAYSRFAGVNYHNDGCCCSAPANYYTIRDDGFIELHEF